MAELRWVLIILGLAIVAAVYVWGRRRAQRSDSERSARVEPQFSDESDWQGPGDSVEELGFDDSGPDEEWEGGKPAGDVTDNPSVILVIHVRAAEGSLFAGASLLDALQAEGLQRAEHGAYEYLSEGGACLFTVANMVEPGTFPEQGAEEFETQGVTSFMVLPGPGNVESLAKMISAARNVARKLDGEVLDETGSTLTNQGATHLREQVIEFQRRSQIGLTDG